MKKILLDDYNQTPVRGGAIGTVTTQFGNSALRHGWKIIEIYESEDNPDREDMEERGQRLGLRTGGLSPTICCGAHVGCQPKIIVTEDADRKLA